MKRILIIDSDEQVASILSIKLKQAGFEAKTAGDTVDALKIIADFRPDLIVSEMIFPKMSGIDFMKRVKMNPEMMHIPFVFLSSSRNVENKILAFDMGAIAVFVKPLFINDFLKNVKEILGECEQKSASLPEGNTPEGSISDISVLNILNIISENSSSGEVEFSASSDKKGTIFCRCGNVVRAETEGGKNRDGMKELYKILSWSDGTFAVNYKNVDVETNISIPHGDVLGKVTEWSKKYAGILKNLPPVDTVVYLDFAKFVEDLNKLPDDIDAIVRNIGETGSKICDIIDSCGDDRVHTAICLEQMLTEAVISPENTNEEKLSENSVKSAEDTENKVVESKNGSESTDEAFDEAFAKSGKNRKVIFFIFFLVLLVAVAIFIYSRGLI